MSLVEQGHKGWRQLIMAMHFCSSEFPPLSLQELQPAMLASVPRE
jgi:hypothetical protein